MTTSHHEVSSPLFKLTSGLTALAGAGGGLAGFLVGEIIMASIDQSDGSGITYLVFGSALWAAAIGAALGLVILAYENWQSLRGRWNRDFLTALPVFFGMGFLGGAAGQASYLFVQNSLTRGIGWALMGLGIGAGIGLLRRDAVQARQGALGGALGGFLGGYIFNILAMVSSAGGGSFSRAVGLMITGAMIAMLMRVVQDALKSAWLLGISTGSYEGKEYPLNTARVTVGASEASDIALFREEWMPPQFGAFVFQDEQWWWQGGKAKINGAPQTSALLMPGATIEFGHTRFRFQTRSVNASRKHPTPDRTPPPTSSPTLPGPAAPSITPTVRPEWALNKADGTALRLPTESTQMQLGRASDNNIVLSDVSVSAHHALLKVSVDVLSVTDLGSTNGTFVNGRRLPSNTPTPLQAGDSIRLGRQEYSVQRI